MEVSRCLKGLCCPKNVPGTILTLHTFGEYLDFQLAGRAKDALGPLKQ